MSTPNSDAGPKKKPAQEKLIVVFVLLTVALLSLFISINHYADGGCDGGLCALAFVYHALPLLIAWVVLIIAYLLSTRYSIVAFILVLISFYITLQVANLDYGVQQTEMLLPIVVLFLVQAGLAFVNISNTTKKIKK